MDGRAWYSGKMAEAFLRESLEQDNAQAKALGESTGYSIVTELISFERGVFTSTARSRLTLSIPGAETREIDIVEHADHGPFPFEGWPPATSGRPWWRPGSSFKQRRMSTHGSPRPRA